MTTAPFPTVFFVYPDGSQIVMAMPGIPRVGDTVSARWGETLTATLYTVAAVVWDLNETRVLVHLAPAARA
jgi:hypothetical protein